LGWRGREDSRQRALAYSGALHGSIRRGNVAGAVGRTDRHAAVSLHFSYINYPDSRALSSSWWRARAEASAIIARTDRRRAASLFLSELNNRHLEACRNAVRQLAALANQPADIDCTIPADRQQATKLRSNLALGAAR